MRYKNLFFWQRLCLSLVLLLPLITGYGYFWAILKNDLTVGGIVLLFGMGGFLLLVYVFIRLSYRLTCARLKKDLEKIKLKASTEGTGRVRQTG